MAPWGLVLWVMGVLLRGVIDSLPLLAVLGLVSGLWAWRERLAGQGAGLVFYGVQFAAFYSCRSTHGYHVPGTFSLAFVVHLPAGVLVVNVFAIAMLAASATLLWRRIAGARCEQ